MKTVREKVKTGQIKHVLFDLDGTLYSSKSGIEYQIVPLIAKHTSLILSIDENETKLLLGKYRTEFKSVALGLQKYHGIDPVVFFEMVYEDINLSTIVEYENLQFYLEKLANCVTLHLLTNSNSSHAKRVLKMLGLIEYFENLFSVENSYFIRKPESIVYENVIDNLDAEPSEIIAIDDSYLNLKTASNLGLYTILVSNGISDPPLYWEMHEKIYHEAPEFVSGSFQNTTDAIGALIN